MADFDTILIANRGEIACRVMRTARAMGLRTVAVYSDADADAPHAKLADRAVRIGSPPVADSYLRIDRILEAARSSGAGAVHPGYGFLSENPAFAAAVEAVGLVFVGPPVGAITVMGDKARAKRAMIAAGVPCVPGYQGADQSDETLVREARAIGYPLMVKAAAGGGGRGMRLVDSARNLTDALRAARSEAINAFGSGELILEKAIARPRHVEMQVFADAHGTVLHFGERDCSVQRRHQKVIEEAPCPVMTAQLRAAMGKAAVEAARAVDYRGAGTVEFLLDQDGAFYFLEMNTRLQVEHPVTEAVTGLDLVELQIRVARGEALGFAQSDVRLEGHAIEVRLYAEDPDMDFLPSTGRALLWSPPAGAGVRVDTGLQTGGEISSFYDPMVAKIIAHGPNRDDARRRLVRALQDTALLGPRSNRDFLLDALQQDVFVRGEATTAFIGETYGSSGAASAVPRPCELAVSAVIQHRLGRASALAEAIDISAELLEWSSVHGLHSVVEYAHGEATMPLQVYARGADAYEVRGADRPMFVLVRSMAGERARLDVDGEGIDVIFVDAGSGRLHLATPRLSFSVEDLSREIDDGGGERGGGLVGAPMHGRLLEILVEEGTRVARGDPLAVLEAMKMQHQIVADVDGTVKAILAAAGTQVAAQDLILEITPGEEAAEG
jgi:geranyl-CoA carboxylase alpha subunit